MTNPGLPVSWLRLERYALGELGSGERAEIAGHLATCARCRSCAERIESDTGRDLRPLPEAVATTGAAAANAVGASAPPRRRRWRQWQQQIGRRRAFAFAAVAGLFALVVIRPGDRTRVVDSRGVEPRGVEPRGVEPHGAGPRIVAVKGGDVTFELVRERAGSTAWEPTSFASGDRFKLLLTCPPPLQLHADLVVLQADGAAFPGAPALIPCGNRVPLPTAFRITGPGAATICVAVDPSASPSRALLATRQSAAQACLHLDRAE